MQINELFHFQSNENEEHWISVSDLMAGLMIVFLFIAVAFIHDIYIDIESNQEKRQIIYNKLKEEFKDEINNRDLVLEEDLTIKFDNLTGFFDTQEFKLKKDFEDKLDKFFPRYIEKLSEDKESIEEIRIEGHTSSEWGDETEQNAYIKNMQLSQNRAREVLVYCLEQTNIRESDRKWIINHLSAKGLSSNVIIPDYKGDEDRDRSKRVEFKIKIKGGNIAEKLGGAPQ